MFPNVSGFSWTPIHIVFLAVFFSVAAVIATTVLLALWRAKQDLSQGKVAAIRWHSAFNDLPARDRACRHEVTGEFRKRCCDRGFDCRECTTHARLIEAHPVAATPDETVFGLRYPNDRLYHRGHTWVRQEPDGTVTIGPDDLSRKMFGRFERIELPAPGTPLQVNGTAWKVCQHRDEFRVLSPVDGEVVATGSPEDGYYLRIRPAGGTLRDTHLLRGAEIRPWVQRELERLQILISPDPNAPTLADGGVLVDDAPDMFPNVNWPAVWGEMLLEP
jgi:glycine cleavage system H protein